MAFNKIRRRLRIKQGIRNRVQGTADRPRLSIFKSNKAIYAQIIDDAKGSTLSASSSSEIGASLNIETSKKVGQKIAEKASAAHAP